MFLKNISIKKEKKIRIIWDEKRTRFLYKIENVIQEI